MKWRIILMITFCIIVYGALFSGCTEATEREIIDQYRIGVGDLF